MNYPLPSIFNPKSLPAAARYVCIPEYGRSQVMLMPVVKNSVFSEVLAFGEDEPLWNRRWLKIALMIMVGICIGGAIIFILKQSRRRR